MPAKRPSRSPDAPERWLILARQSDTDDAGERSLSLDSQERALRDAASARGATVIAALRDADLKGYQDESARPALAEALTRAGNGEYDVLAVWELSRLARKLSLQERVVDRLFEAGVGLYSHREPWASDPLVRQILGAIAEQQTRTISGHVRRAVQERIRQGKWHGIVPYGYRLVDERLAVDAGLAPWVLAIHARYRDGQGIMDIVRWLIVQDAPTSGQDGPNRRDVAPWNWRRVHRVLTNPVYHGDRRVLDAVVPAAHAGIVPDALWAATQERNDRETVTGQRRFRQARPRRVESFLQDGRLRCGCGRAMSVNRRQRDQAARFVCRGQSTNTGSVSCGRRPRSINVDVAERTVQARIAADLAGIRPWGELEPVLRRDALATQPEAARERGERVRRRAALVTRQTRVRELYLSGRVDLAAYDDLTAPLDQQIADLDARLAVTPDVDARLASARTLRALLGDLSGLVVTGDDETMTLVMERIGAVAHIDGDAPDSIRLSYAPAASDLMVALGDARWGT